MVSNNLASKLSLTFALVLSGCSTSRENDSYGMFYEPGKEYSFRGQRVLILYATDDKLSDYKSSRNGVARWPELKSPRMIEDITKKLQENGAYVSFLPVFSDDVDLSLRVCQYGRSWDALLITYPEFNVSTINDENLRDVYIPMLHDEKLVIGKLGTMDDIIHLEPTRDVRLRRLAVNKGKEIF